MDFQVITNQNMTNLCELYLKVFTSDPWHEEWNEFWVNERLNWLVNSPGFYGYYVEINQCPVGAILGNTRPFKGEVEFEVVELFINPSFQGKGIGGKLISYLEGILVKNNVCRITVLTRKSTAAFSFYKNQGYQYIDDIAFLAHALSG